MVNVALGHLIKILKFVTYSIPMGVVINSAIELMQVRHARKYFMCLDFIARHNISSTLPLECIPIQKIRKFCCALFCGLSTVSYINWFPAQSMNFKFEFGGSKRLFCLTRKFYITEKLSLEYPNSNFKFKLRAGN